MALIADLHAASCNQPVIFMWQTDAQCTAVINFLIRLGLMMHAMGALSI